MTGAAKTESTTQETDRQARLRPDSLLVEQLGLQPRPGMGLPYSMALEALIDRLVLVARYGMQPHDTPQQQAVVEPNTAPAHVQRIQHLHQHLGRKPSVLIPCTPIAIAATGFPQTSAVRTSSAAIMICCGISHNSCMLPIVSSTPGLLRENITTGISFGLTPGWQVATERRKQLSPSRICQTSRL